MGKNIINKLSFDRTQKKLFSLRADMEEENGLTDKIKILLLLSGKSEGGKTLEFL